MFCLLVFCFFWGVFVVWLVEVFLSVVGFCFVGVYVWVSFFVCFLNVYYQFPTLLQYFCTTLTRIEKARNNYHDPFQQKGKKKKERRCLRHFQQNRYKARMVCFHFTFFLCLDLKVCYIRNTKSKPKHN